MEPLPGLPEQTTPDERTWAIATHLGAAAAVVIGGWFLNILVPLFVWLMQRDQSAFVADHAREELNFQLTVTLVGFVSGLVAILTLGIALLVIVPLALVYVVVIVVSIIRAALAASRGERYRYPLTIRFVS